MNTGRRERKKAQTRLALTAAALRLFLDHGYDAVTVAQIAEAADVSLATLFAHVPGGKEALIFDDGAERRAGLTAAIRDRSHGQTVLGALREFFATRGPFAVDLPPAQIRKRDLVMSTPALRAHQRTLWMSCEPLLSEEIAAECGRASTDVVVRALARYVLEIPDLTSLEPDPRTALHAVFDLLESGWSTLRTSSP